MKLLHYAEGVPWRCELERHRDGRRIIIRCRSKFGRFTSLAELRETPCAPFEAGPMVRILRFEAGAVPPPELVDRLDVAARVL